MQGGNGGAGCISYNRQNYEASKLNRILKCDTLGGSIFKFNILEITIKGYVLIMV